MADAAYDGDVSRITALLDSGVNINCVCEVGEATPLCFAVESGQLKAVQCLLQRGADVHKGNPILQACMGNRVEIVEALLLNGANANPGGDEVAKGMAEAAGKGYTQIVELMLKHGVRVDPDDPDWGSLRRAAYSGRVEVMRIIISAGADINRQDSDGNTPLIVASKFNQNLGAKVLLTAGARKDVVNRKGLKAVDIAKANGNVELTELLSD